MPAWSENSIPIFLQSSCHWLALWLPHAGFTECTGLKFSEESSFNSEVRITTKQRKRKKKNAEKKSRMRKFSERRRNPHGMVGIISYINLKVKIVGFFHKIKIKIWRTSYRLWWNGHSILNTQEFNCEWFIWVSVSFSFGLVVNVRYPPLPFSLYESMYWDSQFQFLYAWYWYMIHVSSFSAHYFLILSVVVIEFVTSQKHSFVDDENHTFIVGFGFYRFNQSKDKRENLLVSRNKRAKGRKKNSLFL